MHRLVLDRGLGRILWVTLVVACSEPPLAPATPERGPRPLRPNLELVEDNTLPVGALIREVTIVMPEEGAVDGSEVLLALGEVTGPVVVELAGEITVPPQSVSVTELLAPGTVMWFHLNGDFYMRFASLALFQVDPGGGRQVQFVQPSGPRNLIRFRDEGAGLHGLDLAWEFGAPAWTGRNVNDPNWPHLCPGLDDNVYCWIAPRDRISDAVPRGTITVRVYHAVSTERVRVRAVSGPLEVAPKRTAGLHELPLVVEVLDVDDVPIPNREVLLELDGVEGTGGHAHGGTMPNGSLSDATVNTGDARKASVVYTADFFGGKVELRGTSPGAAAAVETVTVRVAGLQELAASQSLGLIGIRAAHPGSHFGTAAMISRLRTVAAAFYAKYTRKLEVNDMSLPLGGKFDINAAYGPRGDHDEHREGQTADVRTHGGSPLSELQKVFVHKMWERLGGTVGDETILENGQPNTESPHYHFSF